MAIPVLVSAELFPFNDIVGSMLPDAVATLNNQIKTFFADKVDIINTPADMSNLTDVTTVFGTGLEDQQAFVQATVVVGFRGVDLEAARELAASFSAAHSGTLFNHISVEVLDPAAVASSPVAQV